MRPLLRFSRQNAIGLLALFVALGGTSYAAVALPRNSVGSAQIKSNAVGSSEVRGSAIGTSELRRGAVSNSDLRSGAVTGSKIRGNSIGSSKVAPGSLLASDFKAGQLPRQVTSATPSGAAGGALSGTYPNPGLAPGSVTASTLGKLPAVRLVSPTGTLQSVAAVTNAAQPTGVRFATTQFNNGDQFGVGATSDGGASLRVPVSGVYLVTGQVTWLDPQLQGAPRDNTVGTRSLYIRGPELAGGAGGVRAGSSIAPASDTSTRQTISTAEFFSAGDEITLSAAQTSGTPLNIRGSQNSVHFSAALLTP